MLPSNFYFSSFWVFLASYRSVSHTEYSTCHILISPPSPQKNHGIQVVNPINPRAVFEITWIMERRGEWMKQWWEGRRWQVGARRRPVLCALCDGHEEGARRGAGEQAPLQAGRGQRLLNSSQTHKGVLEWKKKYSDHRIWLALGVILF